MGGTWRGVKCPNCTIEHGVAVGERHPDRCPICNHPYRFTPEQRAEIDRRTECTPPTPPTTEVGDAVGAGTDSWPRTAYVDDTTVRGYPSGRVKVRGLPNQPPTEITAPIVEAIVQVAHRCATPAPELVGGAEAASLPDGSRVVSSGFYDELPEPGARVHQIGADRELPPIHAPRQWVVLHRAAAAEPARLLTVGDRVDTVPDLDQLPVGARVESLVGAHAELRRLPEGWCSTAGPPRIPAGWIESCWLPVRVLEVPTS